METPTCDFIRWGGAHLGALAVILLCTAVLIVIGRRCDKQGRRKLGRVLGAVLLFEFIGEHILRQCLDSYGPWRENLPLHFCSVMLVISFIALWWQKRWACAFVYFSVLTASIQALITPALVKGFPSIAFFIFFLSHGLLFVAALTIPLVLGWRARWKDTWRSVLLGDVYLLCIIPVNIWLGTNYGFTQHGPEEGSILDLLGPAPWYYLWLQLPALLLFLLMFFPVRQPRLSCKPAKA